MNEVYIINVCSWGKFANVRRRPFSAHPTEEIARATGLKLGYSEYDPEDGGEWFEVTKIPFRV